MRERQSITYYLKATGSTCYDKTGITFPDSIPANLENIITKAIKDAGSEFTFDIYWNRPERNLPQVLIVAIFDPGNRRTHYPDLDFVINKISAAISRSPAGPHLIFRPIEW